MVPVQMYRNGFVIVINKLTRFSSLSMLNKKDINDADEEKRQSKWS